MKQSWGMKASGGERGIQTGPVGRQDLLCMRRPENRLNPGAWQGA